MRSADAARHARSLANQALLTVMRRPMRRLLRSLRNEEVLYWLNPGNAGDALIDLGTRAALAAEGIRWRSVVLDQDVRGRTVLVGGGGNLVPFYDHAATAIDAFVAGGAARIIVLPHTIRDHGASLAGLRAQDLVLCRDEPSLNFVRSTATRGQVGLDHDMALHLTRGDLRRLRAHGGVAEVVDSRLSAVGWSRDAIRDAPVMRLLREDVERSPLAPPGDLDPSALFLPTPGVLDQETAAGCLLEVVACSRTVVTDRLHVGIAAVLLGVPVRMAPNSYGKNEDVFQHSLSRLRGIHFRAWD